MAGLFTALSPRLKCAGGFLQARERVPLNLGEHGTDHELEALLVGVVDLGFEADVVEVAGDGAEAGVGDDAGYHGCGVRVGDRVELDLREADLVDLAKDAGEILRGLAANHEELDTIDEPAAGFARCSCGKSVADAAERAAGGGGQGGESDKVAA